MEVVTAHWFVRVVDHLLTNPEHGGEKDPVLKHPIQVSLSRNRRSTERPAKSQVTFSQAFFWTFRKKLKAKKTQAEKKLNRIFEKLKLIIQKLNNLPT